VTYIRQVSGCNKGYLVVPGTASSVTYILQVRVCNKGSLDLPGFEVLVLDDMT
jgi:hypothetical protein